METMSFKEVKLGEKFAVESRYHGWRIVTIERETKLCLVDHTGKKWRKADGYDTDGNGYWREYLQPITDDVTRKMEISEARTYLARFARKELTDEQALAARAALRDVMARH